MTKPEPYSDVKKLRIPIEQSYMPASSEPDGDALWIANQDRAKAADIIEALHARAEAAEAKVAALENDLTFVPISDDAKDGKRYIVFGLPESNELVRFTRPGWHVASFDMIDERFCLNGGTWTGPFIDPTHYLPNFDPTPPKETNNETE